MPPGPVSVTNRLSPIALATASSSCSRPMNELMVIGMLPAGRRPLVGGGSPIERRVVAQDRRLQLAKFGCRLDPDLVGEELAMPLEHPERLDLAPTPVQGQHQAATSVARAVDARRPVP